jgi:hypothetical protein
MTVRQKRYAIVLLVLCVIAVAIVVTACNSSSSTSATAAPAGSSTTAAADDTTTTAAAASSTTAAAGGTTTVSQTAASIDAAAIYAKYCADCHKRIPRGSVASVQAVTEQGTGSMPGFNKKLSAGEITALATWVANGGN